MIEGLIFTGFLLACMMLHISVVAVADRFVLLKKEELAVELSIEEKRREDRRQAEEERLDTMRVIIDRAIAAADTLIRHEQGRPRPN